MKLKLFLLFLIFTAALSASNYTHKTMYMPPNSTAIISIPANETDMLECTFQVEPWDAGIIFRLEHPDGTIQKGRSINIEGWERIMAEKDGNFKIYFINYYNNAKVYLTYKLVPESEQSEYKKDWCPVAFLLLIPLLFIVSGK